MPEILPEITLQNHCFAATGENAGYGTGKQCAPKWFAAYTFPRHEKRVGQYLNLRKIAYYLPLYQVQRQWNDGSLVTLNLPLFPGYIFVHIERKERTRVLEVPGVVAVVGGTGREPAEVPDVEIDTLRSGLHLHHPEPHPLLTAGQRVRIRCGALAGMEGVVVRQKNRLRVVLTMSLIMQSVSVEVNRAELELLDPHVPAFDRGGMPWPCGHSTGRSPSGSKRLSWP